MASRRDTPKAPAGYEVVKDGGLAGLIYPDGTMQTAGVRVFNHREGELSRLDAEHDFKPVTGGNPIAELRAAQQAEHDAGERPHFG